jgi:large subunit ribosomal protein L10e
MARLRPARTCRNPNSQAWARYSLRKPRKNYVRALPHSSLIVFKTGVNNNSYNLQVTLDTAQKIQLRSNSLDAARVVANKFLEANIPNEYYFMVRVYPHNVIREHKMATGAGADRISQGMKVNAFGRPVSVAARLNARQPVFMIKTNQEYRNIAFKAMKRAKSKLSGKYNIVATPIAQVSAS